MNYQPITNCLACGKADGFDVIMDYGRAPFANDLRRPGDPLPDTAPLKLQRCVTCGHMQLSHAADPGILFGDKYHYASGTSHTLRNHFAKLAEEVVAACESPSPRVLDIASNDGTLVKSLAAEDAWAFGIDPAANHVDACRAEGLDCRRGFWGRDDVFPGETFDAITACNVLAHTPNPLCFLLECRRALNAGGRLWIECPDAREMLRWTQFDTVYHEHYSYWTPSAMEQLASLAGMRVESVDSVPVHGGSLRFQLVPTSRRVTIARKTHPIQAVTNTHVADFERATWRNLGGLIDACNAAKDTHEIVGYGAAAKTAVAMGLAGMSLPISEVVDDNPAKHGLLVPGTGALVVPPAKLAKHNKPIFWVVFCWNFLPEVVRRLRALRGDAGRDDLYGCYVPHALVRLLTENPGPGPW